MFGSSCVSPAFVCVLLSVPGMLTHASVVNQNMRMITLSDLPTRGKDLMRTSAHLHRHSSTHEPSPHHIGMYAIDYLVNTQYPVKLTPSPSFCLQTCGGNKQTKQTKNKFKTAKQKKRSTSAWWCSVLFMILLHTDSRNWDLDLKFMNRSSAWDKGMSLRTIF